LLAPCLLVVCSLFAPCLLLERVGTAVKKQLDQPWTTADEAVLDDVLEVFDKCA
jgi:hypothetical protein